ncbi:hypothetical protein EXIGLDRAFT_839759 [Exidia glandulosa HHB12029]|uniref:Uncharacterized protein n=1 Tax=Exidia glandulosa HHB12029 TaxID=1314781 RepID=A0A165EUM2_EXIGL|nr:hypothetical protein EXIGLDRAFT_839759 [Exidia glandulosa HHB12029]
MLFLDFVYTFSQDILSNALFWSGCITLISVMMQVRPHTRHSETASQPTIIVTHDTVEKGFGDVEVTTVHTGSTQASPSLAIKVWRSAALSWALAVTILNFIFIATIHSNTSPANETLRTLSRYKVLVVHQTLNCGSTFVWALYLALWTHRNKEGCPKGHSVYRVCENIRSMMFIAAVLPLLSAVSPTTFESGLAIPVSTNVSIPIHLVYVLQSIVWAVLFKKSCLWLHEPVVLVVHAEDKQCWVCRPAMWRVVKAELGRRLFRRRQAVHLEDASANSVGSMTERL